MEFLVVRRFVRKVSIQSSKLEKQTFYLGTIQVGESKKVTDAYEVVRCWAEMVMEKQGFVSHENEYFGSISNFQGIPSENSDLIDVGDIETALVKLKDAHDVAHDPLFSFYENQIARGSAAS